MTVIDPIKRKKLHDYLSSQNLTDLSLEDFSTEYASNTEKQNKLYNYLKTNNLTDLDNQSFSKEYFGDVKKKVESESTSENQKLDSAQEMAPGSVDTSQEFKILNKNSYTERFDQQKDNTSIRPSAYKSNSENIPEYAPKELTKPEQVQADIRRRKITEAKQGFKEKVSINEQDVLKAEQSVKDEENIGFWDKAKQGFISTANVIKKIGTFGLGETIENPDKIPFNDEIKEVKKDALKNKEELSEEEIKLKAKELYKEKQLENIFVDKANDFIETLDTETRTILKIDSGNVIENLSFDNKKRASVNQALNVSLNENLAEIEQMKSDFKDRNDITQEESDLYNSKVEEAKKEYDLINKNYDILIKNQEDLLSAEKEYDLFKRTYDGVFFGNAALTTLDLGIGLVDFANYGINAISELNPINKAMASSIGLNTENAIDTSKIREDLQSERELLRKPVESVESVGGFVNYVSDLVANQLPILAVTSTGYGGLTALGASSTGQKFAEMADENKEGANYTPLQMIGVPLLFGTSEAVFELPTLQILKKGKRVLNAAAKESTDLFRKSSTQKVKELGIDFTKENLAEQATNFFQNAGDIYGLGKEGGLLDNALDVLKDTSALTGILQGSPHLLGAALKPFQAKDDLMTLEVNARKMLELGKQLDLENITATEKDVIQSEINRLNTESSKIMSSTIKNVSEMPEELHKEILKINEEAGVLRKQAEDIHINGNSPNKKDLIKIIGDKHSALQEKRMAILKGETTIVDTLPLDQQDKLKREALNELTQELNPDGKKDMTIDDAQITERANQIYLKDKNAKSEENTNKAQEPEVVEGTSKTEEGKSNNNQINKTNDTANLEDSTNDVENTNQITNETTPESKESEKGVENKLSEKSVDDLEKRQFEIEDSKNDIKEFNEIDKELEKREWQSVLNSPINEVESIVDGLMQKEKDKPNGFGSYIEKRDARETKEIAKKYQGEVDVKTAKKDFKDAFFGNPNKWYADGLKLKESTRSFIEQGGTFKELLSSVQKEFESDGFSEQDAAAVINRKLSEITKTNETAPSENTSPDGNISIGTLPSVQQGESDNIQPAIDTGTDTGKTEIRTYKTTDSDKATEYQVAFENGSLNIKDKDGNEPSPQTKRKILDKYSDDVDFTQGETATVTPDITNPNDFVAQNSKNPAELAILLNDTNTQSFIENNIDYKTRVIADHLTNIEKTSYENFGDRNKIGNNMARSYFSKKGEGRSLDTLAEELSEDYGVEITEQDLVEHMENYPGGKNDVYKEFRDNNIKPLQDKFTELTGLPANDKYIKKAVEQSISKEQLNEKIYKDHLSQLTNEELLSLYKDQADYESFQQQNPETDSSNESGIEPENTSQNEGQSRVREKGTGTSQEQASQSRVKTLTNERVKPLKRKPKAKPKKINEIIANVSDKLKATLIYGKSGRRNSAGTYNSTNALVKIRNAGDIDTVAHELGHLLDDRHGILEQVKNDPNQISLVNQLKWFSDRGGSNPPTGLSKAKKAEYLEREGLGEFIRAYIANPKQAKVIAPELYSLFESSIDAETKAILKEFSQDYLDFANATYTEKTLSNIEDSTLPDKEGFKDWLEKNFSTKEGKLNITFMDKLKSNWTNSMHLPNKAFKFIQGVKGVDVNKLLPEESFEVMSRLFAGINGKFNYVFSKGMIDAKGNLLKDSQGKNMNVKYLIEALDGTTEQSLREEMSDVIAYMIAQRTVEYAKKLGRIDNLTGIGAGIDTDLDVAIGTLEEYKQLKKDNPEKHDRIIEGARRYREFADGGLKYALEKGRINQEQYDRIKETNEYYVSLARTKEVTPGEEMLPFLKESNKITSVKEPIKKIKGGTDVIKNPYLSLLQNTVNFIKESDRNEVMESFIEPLRSTRAMGDGTPIDLSQVGRKVPSGEKNTIKLYNNGVLEHWQFDQDIYDGLKGLESIAHNPIISALGKPADLIRFTVTNFPVFALRNAFRDTMSRLIISRTKGNVADLWHNKEDRSLFELHGGSQAGFYMTNREGYKETMNQAIKDLTKKGGIVLDPRKLTYTNYRKLLERGENLNRVAEYNSGFRKAKKEGMDDYNAGLYAAYQARDLMDFAVAGHYMRVINKLVPFSNASVQSVKRSVKGAKENPGKFAMRMALYTVLPQIAFRAMVAANGDDEEYEQLPDYQRDLFWNFKTPLTGDKWISLPKPFELGLPSSLLDRAYSKSKGVENAFEGSAWSSFKTLFPFDETALMGSVKPIIETSANYDFFRDREIVPFWEKDKLLELRDGTKYASRIGSALSDGFGVLGTEVDPRKIDHIIKGYTTYYGDWALSLGDIGKEDSRNQFNATKTGFMRDVPISNAKSVKKAYDLAKSIGADSDKNVKVLKGMVKTYYDLEDKEAKKKLSKAIYQYSQEVLIPYLEAKKQISIVTKDID